MEEAVIRATYPQRGGWADIQIGTTIIDIPEGEVRHPDGSITSLSRDIPYHASSIAIRSRDNILMALDVQGNGLFDIPAGPWQHIDDEHFHRVIIIATVATQVKMHISSANKAFSLVSQGSGSLLHGPPEPIKITIPAGAPVLTTILDLTGKDPIQAFTIQIVSGPIGVYMGYDKDAAATDPEVAVLQVVNRDGYEILNKITVLPRAIHAAPIVIDGEAWRY